MDLIKSKQVKLATRLPEPELPGEAIIRRAFELTEFIQSNHSSASTITGPTKQVLRFITSRTGSPLPPREPESSTRTGNRRSRSPSRSPSYRWPQQWAIDKSVLRQDLTSFDFNTLYIRRYIESTPTPSNLSDQTEEIPRNMSGEGSGGASGNAGNNAVFSPAQMQALGAMLDQAFERRDRRGGMPNNPQDPSGGGGDGQIVPVPQAEILRAEHIGYFDPGFDDEKDPGASVVNSGRHVFYRDVFVFISRL